MKTTLGLLHVATWFVLTLPAAAQVEYVCKGDQKRLTDACSWADKEAQKVIDTKLVPGEHKAALVFCMTVDRLSRYREFKQFTFTDQTINEVVALQEFLWEKPAGHLKSAGHPTLAATASSYKVRLRSTRAKHLFGDDAPKYWSIPKPTEDPTRTYTFTIRD